MLETIVPPFYYQGSHVNPIGGEYNSASPAAGEVTDQMGLTPLWLLPPCAGSMRFWFHTECDPARQIWGWSCAQYHSTHFHLLWGTYAQTYGTQTHFYRLRKLLIPLWRICHTLALNLMTLLSRNLYRQYKSNWNFKEKLRFESHKI